MSEYEYQIQHLPIRTSYEHHAFVLDGMAADGWRLVAVDNGIYYFERRVSPTTLDEPEAGSGELARFGSG